MLNPLYTIPPLKWVFDAIKSAWTATTPIGVYFAGATANGETWYWHAVSQKGYIEQTALKSLEEAQRAASDYHTGVLVACLEPAPTKNKKK